MKKFLLFLVLSIIPSLIFSKNIDYQDLIRFGQNAFQQRISNENSFYQDQIQIKKVDFLVENRDTLMALINFSNGGFILLSADDAVFPVLAYSIDNEIDINNLSPSANDWINIYKAQILEIKRLNCSADASTVDAWKKIMNNSQKNSTSIIVEPLLTAKWNQTKYYNQYSPEDELSPSGYDGKVPNGCVAVAMAMIMYYYRFPITGVGSHTNTRSNYNNYYVNFAQQVYNYNLMEDELTLYNNEVAKLIFHCATSVDMMYGPDGSGAFSEDAASAFKNFFKFSNSTSIIYRSNYSSSNWISILFSELNNKRPMYYSGCSNNGCHAFVCDGYDSDSLIHLNLGWGGSGNGYYTVKNLNSGVAGFYSSQAVIRNIYPATDYPTFCSSTTTIEGVSGTIEDGSNSQNYTNNCNCTYIIAPPDAASFSINIQKIKTEINNDTLSFWMGNPANGRLVASYSGNLSNEYLSVISDSLFITFKTNGSVTDEGWRLDFYVTQNVSSCPSILLLTDQSGTFDDGSGNSDYSANSECYWFIRPQNASEVSYINLSFLDFDISSEDELKIFDTYSSPVLLGTYSGNSNPGNTTYYTNRLKITFRSDNYLQKGGFTAHWETNLSGVENNNQTKGSIFPNPTANYFKIQLPENFGTSCEITIFDMSGKIVKQKSLNSGSSLYQIDVTSLSEGFYMVFVKNQYDLFSHKLIIKKD